MPRSLVVMMAASTRTGTTHVRPITPQKVLRCLLLFVACGVMSTSSAADLSSSLPVERIDVTQLQGIDLDGRLQRFTAHANCQATAIVFLSTECPISRSYLPLLKKLSAQYHKHGMSLYGVISAPGVTRAAALQHREEFALDFPVIFDASGELRRLLQPTHAPQAIVISVKGKVLYSGRIDDRYSQVGQRRDQARVHDLRDALQSTLEGRKVPASVTTPVGCRLEDLPAAATDMAVTYHRDIAPILYAQCADCHREGEAAPFTLLSYDDACRHAAQMVDVTQSRFMPPWHPEPGFGHFQNERRLTDQQIAMIQRWVQAGKPAGNPADEPPRPRFTPGWQLGTPDLILKMDEAYALSEAGPDVHQHFVLPTGIKRNRLVAAVEFRPGNPRVVHHACFYVDDTGSARKLDAKQTDVGYGSFVGPGFANTGALRSWLPGMSPQRLPEGTGQPLKGDSDLVLEIHYQRSGKPETDQSTVGIYFAPTSARHEVAELQVMNKALIIPAGEKRYRHLASYTLPAAATLLDAAPHLHLLGREMKAIATKPDGTVVPLIWIKHWDFNWQGQYLYVNPVALPQGTRIDVEAWYDNSAENPLNPHSPPQAVSWGEQTHEEMAICHFRYHCGTPQDLRAMNQHHASYCHDQQRQYDQMRKTAQK